MIRAVVDVSFYRMTPFEVASGWLFGEVPDARPAGRACTHEHGWSQPCAGPGVHACSGARPPTLRHRIFGGATSALLAVASRLAAREGFEPPVAGTLRYPGEHEAHEDQWQELVVRHLGHQQLGEAPGRRFRRPARPDRFLRTETPRVALAAAHHTEVPLYALAAGGTLVNGEGATKCWGRTGSRRWRGARRAVPEKPLGSGRDGADARSPPRP